VLAAFAVLTVVAVPLLAPGYRVPPRPLFVPEQALHQK